MSMQVAHRSSTSHAPRMDSPLIANGPPLDYSFKELRCCSEIETEEPRSGLKRGTPELPKDSSGEQCEEGDVAAAGGATASGSGATGTTMPTRSIVAQGGKPIRKVLRQVTTAVKLNNNMLATVSGLQQSLEFVMNSVVMNLQWIDLSFNQLVTVEPELLRFLNLKALYLHGNCIKSLSSVDRLKKLPKLISLTMNGNPVDSTRIYRVYVIGSLPNLRSLDHSTITQDEISSAAAWYAGHQERAKKRAEERQFAGLDDD
mmetsp:Transcript_81589/g.205302  ORF Transcript_81589/g.205302 Transcript_81589/m.205302 type:complete len:259 (+) Transcript_81589:77-853(+)|eukprot:CAMPEP_0115234732 /NCGR_PEP_ID=MMETSP0270-20121206/34943_1 /TAXON_ID=71861 /ORGANISM="Scrippsiella trochoidea, Strain CCMP3099" /LENGTH=258 /DNA_ID=CAMNT_0002649485 /DNA_START=67 /DNA_END=843 /DNA_ORIENTATION=-